MSRSSCGKSDACFRSMANAPFISRGGGHCDGPANRLRQGYGGQEAGHRTSSGRPEHTTKPLFVSFVFDFGLGDAISAAYGVGNLVDDDVRARVAQNEMTSNESIFQILRKVG